MPPTSRKATPRTVTLAPKVSLNIDELRREGSPAPFTVALGGRPYALRDPYDLPWDLLANIEKAPIAFLSAALDDDGLIEQLGKLPAWKVKAVADAYATHYGLGAPGEDGALPT